MPRSNRPKRSKGYSKDEIPELNPDVLRFGIRTTAVKRGISYTVQSTNGASAEDGKTWICPECGLTLTKGTSHTVAWDTVRGVETRHFSQPLLETFSRAFALIEIRSDVELPSKREAISLHTEDGLSLVAELAMPAFTDPVATLITLHPLPTHGGFMDSHVFRKAANRLPALADLAILRFNTRGTTSPHGKSDGFFDQGVGEAFDLRAAVKFVAERQLPNPWLVGWSFGTELALKYGADQPVLGAVLLAPPLHRTSEAELRTWNETGKRVVALVPEFDDYLVPEQAKSRFKALEQAEVIGIEGAKHLWVGENSVRRVLDEIVKIVNPVAYPLPTHWEDPTS